MLKSTNAYLSDVERTEAAQLHAVLTRTAAAVKSGRTDWSVLEGEASDVLTARGWRPD
jgi:pantoate--beta-alanine ligase